MSQLSDNQFLAYASTQNLPWSVWPPSRTKQFLDQVYPILVILASYLLPIFTQILVTIPFLLMMWRKSIPGDPVKLLSSSAGMATTFLLANFLPIFPLIAAWLAFFERRSLRTAGFLSNHIGKKYLRGFIVGFILVSALTFPGFLLGSWQYQSTVQPFSSLPIGETTILLTGWMIQGAAEELLMRGFLLPVLAVRYGRLIGIMVSSAVFAALHLLNLNISPLAVANLALFGIFAAMYALREQSIWGISALHTAWNWSMGNLYGLKVSGNIFSKFSLFHLEANGPEWITGGAFGPEASLVTSLILLAGIIYLSIAREIPGDGI